MTLRLTEEDERVLAALAAEGGISRQEATIRAVHEVAARRGHARRGRRVRARPGPLRRRPRPPREETRYLTLEDPPSSRATGTCRRRDSGMSGLVYSGRVAQFADHVLVEAEVLLGRLDSELAVQPFADAKVELA